MSLSDAERARKYRNSKKAKEARVTGVGASEVYAIINGEDIRRARSDSHERLQTAFDDSQKMHVPPASAKMTVGAAGNWVAIMRGRAFADWTEYDLVQASILAVQIDCLANESKLLAEEGAIVYDNAGLPKANPRAAVVKSLQTSVSAFNRQLGLCVGGVASSTFKNGRDLESTARDVTKDDEDGLIS